MVEPTALRTRPRGPAIEPLGRETEFGSPRVLAVVSQDGGWLEVMASELANGETGWVRADSLDVGGVDYSLRASLSERTLEVRRRGRLVRRAPVGVGAPSTPTPTGTYAVTDKLDLGEGDSPYGCCVLALTGHQPQMPQEWPGGDRLAVHGTQDETAIGGEESLGCLHASAAEMEWLVTKVPLGTRVTIVP